MTEMLLTVGIGALAGAAVGLSGYLKVLKQEEFEWEKAGVTVVIGCISGAVIYSGIIDYSVLVMLFEAAGLGVIAENVIKGVIRLKKNEEKE